MRWTVLLCFNCSKLDFRILLNHELRSSRYLEGSIGGKAELRNQSCFNDPVKWIKAWFSELPLEREFAEEIHGFGEYCKFEHDRQAIAKANN